MYLQAVRRVLDHLEKTQTGAVECAATLVAESLQNGGVVYCYEIGHGNQLDFLNRAGGLAAVQAFNFSFVVNDSVPPPLKDRSGGRDIQRDLETVRQAVRVSNLRAGDVMLLGSVSGKNRVPVELAVSCREIGVKVVAFTSLAYSDQMMSLHPSGKRLFEVADVVIDNGAPYGDAACELEGLDGRALPVSGVGAIVAGWMIWEAVIEKMTAAGMTPTVYQSVNLADGPDTYQKLKEQYEKRGY